jgi:hypothetical protein
MNRAIHPGLIFGANCDMLNWNINVNDGFKQIDPFIINTIDCFIMTIEGRVPINNV